MNRELKFRPPMNSYEYNKIMKELNDMQKESEKLKANIKNVLTTLFVVVICMFVGAVVVFGLNMLR